MVLLDVLAMKKELVLGAYVAAAAPPRPKIQTGDAPPQRTQVDKKVNGLRTEMD
ncbi:hypothetical protein VKT23_020371 [Stygiomarasmius scandens]|uniref:Uncharacterized protein n=1 Tax=Marasmiellus scandens TaxID=2682957 RepID=A0ABR1ILT5_9AGAR